MAEPNSTQLLKNNQNEVSTQAHLARLNFQSIRGLLGLLDQQTQAIDNAINAQPQENREVLAEELSRLADFGVSHETIESAYYLPQDTLLKILEKLEGIQAESVHIFDAENNLIKTAGHKEIYQYLLSEEINLTQLANAESSVEKARTFQIKIRDIITQNGTSVSHSELIIGVHDFIEILELAQRQRFCKGAIVNLTGEVQHAIDNNQANFEMQAGQVDNTIDAIEYVNQPAKETKKSKNIGTSSYDTSGDKPSQIKLETLDAYLLRLDRQYISPTDTQSLNWNDTAIFLDLAYQTCAKKISGVQLENLGKAILGAKTFLKYRLDPGFNLIENLTSIQVILEVMITRLDSNKFNKKIQKIGNIYHVLSEMVDFAISHVNSLLKQIIQEHWAVVEINTSTMLRLPASIEHDAEILAQLLKWLHRDDDSIAPITIAPTRLYDYIIDQLQKVEPPINTYALVEELENIILSPLFLHKYLVVRDESTEGVCSIQDICADLQKLQTTKIGKNGEIETKAANLENYSALTNFYRVFHPVPTEIEKIETSNAKQNQAIEEHSLAEKKWLQNTLAEIAILKILANPMYTKTENDNTRFARLYTLQAALCELIKEYISNIDSVEPDYQKAQQSVMNNLFKIATEINLGEFASKTLTLRNQRNLDILSLGKNPSPAQLNEVNLRHNKILLLYLHSIDESWYTKNLSVQTKVYKT